jgi:chromate reductase
MQDRPAIRVLGISGSLRQASSNTALLDAAAQLAPAGVNFSIFNGLADLPAFNPDLDDDDVPATVRVFRSGLQLSDAIVLSSPEYAHGVPGVLKNALDWVVGSGELIDKPIALINASSRATHAWRSLFETLTTMSARIVLEASATIPLDGRRLTAEGIAHDAGLSLALQTAFASLIAAVHRQRPLHPSIDDAVLRAIPAGNDRSAYVPLLSLADGSAQQLHSYLQKGTLYTYWLPESTQPAGAVMAIPEQGDSVELKAVAVVEAMQGMGIGSRMVRAVVEALRQSGVRRLTVGTASSGVRELRFYQKAGFRLCRIDRDFFSAAKGYPADLRENGIPVRDMVWMDLDLA